MLTLAANLRVYIATGSTDMRKAINGLSILVESRMKLDPFSGQVFVFSNKRRNMIKILYWDQNGFCLWQKRLERERFRWPKRAEEVIKISPRELRWLLDGLELVQSGAHRQLQYSSVT
jgi:transposase